MGSNIKDLWKNNRRFRIWTRILTGISIVFFLGVIGISMYLNGLVNRRLKEVVQESSDGLYQLKYSRVSVNALTGNLTIYNAELIPNTTVFAQLQRGGKAPRFLVGGKVSRLVADNVRSLAFLSNRKLRIGRVAIVNPRFNLIQYRLEKDTVHDASGVYQLLSKRVKDLRIGTFNITNAIIHYQVIDTTATARTINKIEHLDLGFKDVHFGGKKDGTGYLAADDYYIRLKEYRHRTSDSLYWVGLHGFNYNSKHKRVSLDSFYVHPELSQEAFGKRVGHQASRYQFRLKDITADKFDLSTFAETGIAVIENVKVDGGAINIDMDRSLPAPREDRRNVVISQKLKTLGLPFGISVMQLQHLDLTYREYNSLTEESAVIAFKDLACKASNITNLESHVKGNGHMKLEASALFLNAQVRMDLVFDLKSAEGNFTARVSANQIEAARLNDILVPIAKIEARKGLLRKLEANLTGNQAAATGSVNLTYEDLKISLLKKDGDSLKRSGFKSMFANMMIPDDNPKDGILRTAPRVTAPRKFGRSFFSMLWSAVSLGIQEIILGKKGAAIQSP
ncbi:MAG TPA: hypothetical protein VD996_12170 [Chitinophagaceae bacterium]|nr:hypothetical protein [Chitinophagaceae bacterium]